VENPCKISESEWKVMDIIWSKFPVTANQVVEFLEPRVNWKPKTIKTMLNRLIKKKIIDFNKNNRTYYYYPLISKGKCIKAENKSFLERIHAGSLNLMIASFLKEEELSKEEIEELKRIINENIN